MAYYIYNNKLRTAIGFATKRDAIISAINSPDLSYNYGWTTVYADKNKKKALFTIQYMGWGIYNYYKGESLSWKEGETPMVIGPNGTVVPVEGRKKSRKKR